MDKKEHVERQAEEPVAVKKVPCPWQLLKYSTHQIVCEMWLKFRLENTACFPECEQYLCWTIALERLQQLSTPAATPPSENDPLNVMEHGPRNTQEHKLKTPFGMPPNEKKPG